MTVMTCNGRSGRRTRVDKLDLTIVSIHVSMTEVGESWRIW